MSEEALQSQVTELRQTVQAYETERKAADDRSAAAIKEAGAKAAADLEAANAKLTSTQERLDTFEKREAAKADEAFKALPKDAQKKISKLKDKLNTAEWLELVNAEKAGAAPAGDNEDADAEPPPNLGSGKDRNKGAGKQATYKPQFTETIEEALGREVENLQLAQVEEDRQGNKSFKLPMKTFRKKMTKVEGTTLSKENAAKR